MRKELYDEQPTLARPVPATTKTEGKVRTTKLVSRKVESDQGGLMSYGYLPHASSSFLVVFLVLPGSP